MRFCRASALGAAVLALASFSSPTSASPSPAPTPAPQPQPFPLIDNPLGLLSTAQSIVSQVQSVINGNPGPVGHLAEDAPGGGLAGYAPASNATTGIGGRRTLYTNSLAFCSEPGNLRVSSLDLLFYPDNSTLFFSIDAQAVNPNLRVTGSITLNAYAGLAIAVVDLNLCDNVVFGLLCPLPTAIPFKASGSYVIPQNVTDQIPSIAYSVPDLELLATVQLRDSSTGQLEACVQATLSNGRTMYQRGAVWATAALAIFSGLSSLLHTTIAASTGAAQWRSVDVMTTLQHVAITGMLSIVYPNAYLQYAKNVAWSVGLVDIESVQKSIDATRLNSGGGHYNATFGPALAALRGNLLNSTTPAYVQPAVNVSLNNLQRRSEPFGLTKRLLSLFPFSTSNSTTAMNADIPTILGNTTDHLRGMDIFVENNNIHPANAFITFLVSAFILLAIFVLAILVVFALALLVRLITAHGTNAADNDTSGQRDHHHRFGHWAKRFIRPSEFLGIFAPTILSRWLLIVLPIYFVWMLWAWYAPDGYASTVLAAVFLAVLLAALAACVVPMIIQAHKAGTPEILYHHPERGAGPRAPTSLLARRIGLLAQPYKPKFFWFSLLFVAWAFARAVFVSLAQADGLAQAVGLLAVEVIGTLLLLILRPAKDVQGDLVQLFLALTRIVSWGICVALTRQANVTKLPRVIIGFVLIAVTAIPVIFLFLVILFDLFAPFCTRYLWKATKRQRTSPDAWGSSKPENWYNGDGQHGQHVMQHTDATGSGTLRGFPEDAAKHKI